MDKNIENYLIEIEKIVGERILYLRIKFKISRRELAATINVSEQQLAKYEKNINRISIGRLSLIANKFKKDINYFIS